MEKHEHSLFFVDAAEEGSVCFSREELRHALLALRMDARAPLKCTDGNGAIFSCVQTAETAVSGKARIVETLSALRPQPQCAVFIGLPDRDAFEESLTNLAALGVDRIIPMVCRFCQHAWWDRWDKYADRLRRKMIAGIKQSLNPWLPQLTQPQSFAQATGAMSDFQACLVADSTGMPLRQAVMPLAGARQVACFVGPPGGFSPEELSILQTRASALVRIGPYRLRTELAAVVLCASVVQARGAVNHLNSSNSANTSLCV
jgi:16S rRNA (uracil1498-N3)-methyltransferase